MCQESRSDYRSLQGQWLRSPRQIVSAGWTVLAAARDEELGKTTAAKLQAEGLDVQFIHIDLNDHGTAFIAAEAIRKQFGKLILLITTLPSRV